jgi:short subunit dehydrogenase-like uncharacterized protein
VKDRLLIYGSYGYTGSLIAREAAKRGLTPILAGRDGNRLEAQASELGLDHRAFSLDDPAGVAANLEGIHAVLHCAGPFSRTAEPMVEACLKTKTHYLDITGEIAVFEAIAKRDAEAKEMGVMLLPGTGFDVVPSDCLAAYLKRKLPTATHLALGFQGVGGRTSRGTAKTMLEVIPRGSVVRQAGKLVNVPLAHEVKEIDFGLGPTAAATIPWGDVATATYSTGIPNVEVYAAIPRWLLPFIKVARPLGRVLDLRPLRRLAEEVIMRRPPGPTEEERERGRTYLWGEARDGNGNRAVAWLRCPEGYTTTVLASLLILGKVLAGHAPPGFQTPAKAYGAELVFELEGVELREARTAISAQDILERSGYDPGC